MVCEHDSSGVPSRSIADASVLGTQRSVKRLTNDIALDVEPADRGSDALVLPLAAALALVAHAAVIGALLMAPIDPVNGGGGQLLDAISVEIVASDVMESRAATPEERHAAPAREAVAAEDGQAADDKAAAQPGRSRAKASTAPQSAALPVLTAPQSATEDTVTLAAARPDDTNKAEPDERRPQHTGPVSIDAETKSGGAASQASTTGGAQAQAATVSASMSGRAAASPGALQKYANLIRVALTKARPTGRGRQGTVAITFAIGPSGALRFAKVTGASGLAAIDDAALSAVRRVRFPAPPEGMTDEQRTYTVPFYFR